MGRRFLHIFIAVCTLSLLTTPSWADNKKFLVVLDAGHGGHDSGAVGRPTTNREKDINLAIVLKVGKLLKQNCPDVEVLYTRDTDVFVTLSGRADIANKAKADLFVSVHTNAIERSATHQALGVQSYTLSLKTAGTNLEVEKRENSVIQFEADGQQKYSFMNPNSPESEIMFELMQDRDMQESVNFAKLAQDEMVRSGGRNDMGVLQANLAVLRLTYMPSVLLEVGFISTPSEETFLMSDEGRTVMAQCIYNAISRYKTQHTGRMSNLEKINLGAVQKQIDEKEAERLKAEEEAKRIEEEKAAAEQAKLNEAAAKQNAEEEAKRKAEEARIAEENRLIAEKARKAEADAKKAADDLKKIEAEMKQAEADAKRIQNEAKAAADKEKKASADLVKATANAQKSAQAAAQAGVILPEAANIKVVDTPQIMTFKATETTPEKKETKTTDQSGIVFKVQLFASQYDLNAGSPQFKGLDAKSFKEGDLYKYTYGETNDYNEIQQIKKEIADKFPSTFIVAFKNGVKMNVNEAIKEWKVK